MTDYLRQDNGVLWCGPPGMLQPFPSSELGTETVAERLTNTATLLSGGRVVQRAPRVSRSWEIRVPAAAHDDVARLHALEQGAFGPFPYVFYDPFIAGTNMLKPEEATAGLGGVVPDYVSEYTQLETGPYTLSDNTLSLYRLRGFQQPLGVRGSEPGLPVIRGHRYSLEVEAHNPTGPWFSYIDLFNRAGEFLPQFEVKGTAQPTESPYRLSITTVVPFGNNEDDTPVYIGGFEVIEYDQAEGGQQYFYGAALHEGWPTRTLRAGVGMPYVVPTGGVTETYDTPGRRTVSLTLTEVGNANTRGSD